jgi:hypothetical protein
VVREAFARRQQRASTYKNRYIGGRTRGNPFKRWELDGSMISPLLGGLLARIYWTFDLSYNEYHVHGIVVLSCDFLFTWCVCRWTKIFMYRSCKPQKLQRSWMKNYNIIISIHRIWSNVEYPRLAPEDLCTLDRLTTPRMWFRCGMWCRVFASDYRHARGASTTSITVHHWLRLRVRHD